MASDQRFHQDISNCHLDIRSSGSIEIKTPIPTDDVYKPENEIQDDEQMEWETSVVTVSEIKKLWQVPSSEPVNQDPLQNTPLKPNMGPSNTKLIIVPDSNIWIGFTDLIRRLLNLNFSRESLYPTIVIPWMVLQELDVKKAKDTSTVSVQRGVNTATKFMLQLLSSRHPRVVGQKASECALSEEKFQPSNADDKILLCALQCADRNPNSLVVFLTNDQNLLNKALIESVTEVGKRDKLLVCDSSSVVAKIKERLKNTIERSRRLILIPKRTILKIQSTSFETEEIIHKNPPILTKSLKRSHGSLVHEEDATRVKDNWFRPTPAKQQLKDCKHLDRCDTFASVLTLLEKTFSYVIESQMKKDFGEDWGKAVKIKPPWTLQSAVNCIILHWIAVFSFVFGRKALVHAKSLLVLIKEYNRTSSSSALTVKTDIMKQNEEDILEMVISLVSCDKSKGSIIKDSDVAMGTCRKSILDYLKRNKV